MMLLRGVKEGLVNYVQMGVTQREMEFLLGRKANKSEIYEIFAPGLESALAFNSNRAGGETGKDAFYEWTIYPLLMAFAEKFNQAIVKPCWGDEYGAEFDDIRSKDKELELKEQQAAEKLMTVAEARERFYELKPLGDERDNLLVAEIGTGLTDARTPEVKAEAALAIAQATQPKEPDVTAEKEDPKQLPAPQDEEEEAAKAVKMSYDGVMVAFYLPRMEAELLWLVAQHARNTTEAEVTPVEDMHLTLCIVGKKQDDVMLDRARMEAALQEFARRAAPLSGSVGGYGVFNGQQGLHPIYASFDSPDLPEFRQRLVDLLQQAGIEIDATHGFTPHITLSYSTMPDINVPNRVPALGMTFDAIALAWGEDRTFFPLLGKGWEPKVPDQRLLEELAKWETKALKRFKSKGSGVCTFESEWIAPEVAAWVADGLEHATTPAAVKAALKAMTRADLDEWEGKLADALAAVFEKYHVQSVGALVRDGVVDLSGLEAALKAELTIILEQAVLDALERAIDEVGAGADMEALLLGAREWAAPYGAESARSLTSTTAKLIESAIRTYRDTPGMTRAQLEAMLRVAFSPSRAVTIAVTEITRASVQATTQYKKILEAAGLELEEIWLTNNDSLVCPTCGPRNGKPTDGFRPPAHGRCRCRTVLRIVARGA
jgi:2'-5' RNA ligase